MDGDLALHIQSERHLLLALNFALIFSLLGLCFTVLLDPYIKKRSKRILLVTVSLTFVLILQNLLDRWFTIRQTSLLQLTVSSMIGYQVRPLILMLFIMIMDSERKYKHIWIPVAVNGGVYATALFSDVAYKFLEPYQFSRGPLGYTCHVVSFGMLLLLLALSVRKYENLRRLEMAMPLVIAVLIICATIADTILPYGLWISYLTVAVVVSCILYYQWLHLQFAREHERALLAEQRIQIMISQIQPHFLYNTLSTIQALCKVDPDKAFEVTERFGTYLRQNIDSLNRTGLIPFQKELEHTKVYAEIEMVRFPNVKMEMDVRGGDFLVPALTLQPIVENSIRHGVRIREHGIIRVSAERREDYYEVIVWDNGVGFRTEGSLNDEGTHIGIRNVRERIERMCGGSLTVESFPEEGTIVTMRFPFSRQTFHKQQEITTMSID